MTVKLNRVKGMYDIVPDDTALWQQVEGAAVAQLNNYGFSEIRLPLLERTEVFSRAIGQGTDVVAKEMYTFADRNGESLSLRPEGTAGCVRAALQHGLFSGHAVKLWYAGAMFRHENVQRGRNRQFYQVGGEVFGLTGPDADFELIALLVRLWAQLHISNLRLELNSLGTPRSRHSYREVLTQYLHDHADQLDDDSRRRLEINPLRILDSKNPQLVTLIAGAPDILEHLDGESTDHFEALKGLLDAQGIDYVVNPRLVRGLDYYSRTVFEFKTEQLGSQGTVCAGGRYDTLVEIFGGKPTPAVGFSMGVDRIVELLTVQGHSRRQQAPHLYLVAAGDAAQRRALILAEQLRSEVDGLRVACNLGGGSFKAQFKRADRSGAGWALILGEEELAQQITRLKPLRNDGPQQTVAFAQLAERLSGIVADVENMDTD